MFGAFDDAFLERVGDTNDEILPRHPFGITEADRAVARHEHPPIDV